MRRITRRARRPAFTNSNEFRQAMDDFAAFHFRGGTRGKQGRSPLRRLLQPFEDEVSAYLREQFDGRCAYTELALVPDESADLAWHRPPGNTTAPNGDVSSDHYWWLAFDWRNWYTASPHIASAKGSSFPVVGERMSVPVLGEPAMPRRRGRLDSGLILDPCEDPPAYWLRFDEDGRVEARRNLLGVDRGLETIDELALNNQSLRDARSVAIEHALRAGGLAEFSLEHGEHPGAATQVLVRRHFQDNERLSAAQVRSLIADYPHEFLNELVESQHDIGMYSPAARNQILELAEHGFESMPTVTFGDAFGDLLIRVYGEAQQPKPAPVSQAETTQPASKANRRAINPTTRISPTSRIERIEIKNFRAIVHLVLELNSAFVDLTDVLDLDDSERAEIVKLEGRQWKMLLGENGSGKSSILHAIALALAGAGIEDAMETAELTWDDLLRWQNDDEKERASGQIRLDFLDGARVDLRFDEHGHRFHGLGQDAPAIHMNIRGYGAARFPSTKRSEIPAVDANQVLQDASATSCDIDNLLDSTVPILNAKEWLGRLDDPAFNVAAETISDLLGESSLVLLNSDADIDRSLTGQRITREDGDATQAPRKVLVDGEPLSLVSDGYRSVIALGCEIMAGVGGLTSESGGISDMRDANGVVLIDEVGAHLHPRWRMQITGKLRKAFPKVQFFVTTHEPLCLRGLVENEVVRVTKYEKHGVLLDEIERAPGRYRVDQLLTSEFFGLNSAIDPRVDRLFTEYYKLKRQSRPSSATLERIEELEAQINDRALRPVLGYTRRDQLIFEAIDDFLIDDALHTALPKDRRSEREKIVRKVAAIWNRFGDSSTE